MSKRYTEGTAGNVAAILDYGKQITITEILDRLNNLEAIILGKNLTIPDVIKRKNKDYERRKKI